MEHTNYHRILRVSAVVLALVLMFESGLFSEATVRVSQNTHSYLANAIGMSARVQPTELNQLTAALTAKERDLAAREAALSEREIAVNFSNGYDSNAKTTYLLASILFILLVLILLNYILDYLRTREERLVDKTV